MGYMYRYNPAIVLLRDMLKKGWLGEVFEVHTVMSKVVGSASRKALAAIDKSADDMEMLEINEAFAPQVLGCVKELGWDLDKVNMNGGAIAMGHPLAASGARITAHLVHNVRRAGGGYALGSACIGGGQGIAVIVEAV